jgi:hypothetical protein
MKLCAFAVTITAFGLAAGSFVSDPLRAEELRSTVIAQTAQTKPAQTPMQTQTQRPAVKKIPGTGTIANPGRAVVDLTTHDCTNTRGTVITVTDGRCGASGQYCRYSDGYAICIDKRD